MKREGGARERICVLCCIAYANLAGGATRRGEFDEKLSQLVQKYWFDPPHRRRGAPSPPFFLLPFQRPPPHLFLLLFPPSRLRLLLLLLLVPATRDAGRNIYSIQ